MRLPATKVRRRAVPAMTQVPRQVRRRTREKGKVRVTRRIRRDLNRLGLLGASRPGSSRRYRGGYRQGTRRSHKALNRLRRAGVDITEK